MMRLLPPLIGRHAAARLPACLRRHCAACFSYACAAAAVAVDEQARRIS